MRTARCAWSALKADRLIRNFGPMARPAPGAPANQQRRMGVLVSAKREGFARCRTFGLLSRFLKISAAPCARTGAAGTLALSWLGRASPGLRERSTQRPCRWNWHEESALGESAACAGWLSPRASTRAGSRAWDSTATWPPSARQSTTPASDAAETVASAMAATMAAAAQDSRRCRSLTPYTSARPGDKARAKQSDPRCLG